MNGAAMIAAERRRQVERLGWTPEHDAEHDHSEMNKAARVYMIETQRQMDVGQPRLTLADAITYGWPDDWEFNPSKDPVRNLVKAGALIAAEIDRLQREGREERAAEAIIRQTSGVAHCPHNVAGACSLCLADLQTIAERDEAEKWADALATGIAAHFKIDIGEHSSSNNPWSNALAAITLRESNCA